MKISPLKLIAKTIAPCVIATLAALSAAPAQAAVVTLTASDATNTSSFNTAGHWSNSQAPSSANTYQAAFTLRSNATGTFLGTSLEILSGGDLRIKTTGNTTTVNNLIVDNGGIVDLGSSGTSTLAGSISLPSGQGSISAGTTGTGNLVVSAVISGAGGFTTSNAISNGPGTVVLNATNTYSGATDILNGANLISLQLGNANAAQNSTVTVSQANGLLFSPSIPTFNVGALAGSVAETLADTGGTAITLSAGRNNASTTYTGVLGGAGALTKAGTGTFTLSGVNTYAGATTISAGVLKISAGGNLSATSNVSIAAGASFDVSALTTYTLGTSATLSASGTASAATLKGGTTVNLGSRPVRLTYDGSHAALALTTGTLQLSNNTFTVVVPGAALAAGTYTLVTTLGAITGTPNATPSFTGGNGIVSGATGTISKSGNNIVLTVTGGSSGPITLVNPSFETNTSGVVFTAKVSTGYDVSGNDVAGWLNTGTTYTDSGVDFAGHASMTAQSGTVVAYCKAGDGGAYQISGYAMQAGDQLTLTWWAKSSFGSAGQVVSLLRATSTSSAFSTLTSVASSTAALNQTGNGGAYTQYTLNYTATAADVGRFVAVSVAAAGPAASKWAVFDSFALSVVSGGGGPGPVVAANSTVSPATASIVANGTSTQIITVQARDSSNVNLTTGGATVVFSRTGTGTLSATTDNGNGTYRATLTSPTSAGSATVTATLNGTAVGSAVGATQSQVTFTSSATASAANSTLSPGQVSLTANGGSTQVLTVQARNASNVNLTTGGATVVISRSGTGTLSGTTDNGNGTYTATLTAPSATGSATVTATLNGTAVGTAVSANQSLVTYYSNTSGDPLPGLTAAESAAFTAGSTAFAKVQDVSTGLGPIFNNSGCANCHNFPVAGGSGSALVTRFGKTTNGVFDPLTSLGGSLLQDNSTTSTFETVPSSANVSIRRSTTPLFGLGLIEAIPDSTIQANAALSNADGIVGTVALVTDVISGQQRVGRFGWKAQLATLLAFTADAANNEVGMTNRVFPVGNAPNGNVTVYNQLNTVADPNDVITAGKADIDRQTEFQRLLSPPPTLALTANAIAGKALFTQIRCDICHTPTMTTAASFTPVSDLPQSPIAALSNKSVALYSDLLLHNMGSLGDGIAQGAATTTQMRTPPLWGLRSSIPYLHDGRTPTVDGAIRAHAGDGLLSANRYIALPPSQQSQLLQFLGSL